MEPGIIIGIYVVIIGIYCYCARVGGEIAVEKGFTFGKYAALCVFAPIIGHILVAALPDRGKR